MPAVNRHLTKAQGGQMRLSVRCPVCGGRCKVDNSRQVTNRLREHNGQCLNMQCGWTGVFATEATRTITPPSPAYDAAMAPPQLSKAEILADIPQADLI